jgi:hypothetical protein
MDRAGGARRRRLLSNRDEEVLAWIGEQYLAPRDVLGQLLGRASEHEAARAAGRVTDTVVDRTLRRWRDLGLAQCQRFLVGEMATVWPTRTGLTVAGLGYRASEPSMATLAHRHAVARVRVAIEAANPQVGWICERELRDGTAGRQAHLPDGVVHTAQGRTAIEVELTPKTEERVRDILWRLTAVYDRVVYYATPRAGAVVRKAGRHHLDRGTLIIRPYPLTGPCVDFPPTAQPNMATPVTAQPDAEAPETPAPSAAVVVDQAVVPVTVAAGPGAEDRPSSDPSRRPGLVEQQALTLTEAQVTALTGVEDAWRAAGHALTRIGRRRRRDG